MFDLVKNINCWHFKMYFCSSAWRMLQFIRNCSHWLYLLHIRMNNVPQPQEEIFGCYFQSGTCLVASENHVLLSFLWSLVCKWPVINFTVLTLKTTTQNTTLMGWFPIVLMQLLELYMCELDININYRHMMDVYLLIRVTYVTFFFTKLHIMTL